MEQHAASAASPSLILPFVFVLSLARFRWDVKSFKPDFSISPTKGYISPGMDVPFVVSFHPLKPSLAIQYEGLQCFIQGSEPLRLTLAGCCLEAPVSKEVTAAGPGRRLEAPHLLPVSFSLPWEAAASSPACKRLVPLPFSDNKQLG